MEILTKMLPLLLDVKLSNQSDRDEATKVAIGISQAIEKLPDLEKRVIKMAYYLESDNNDTYESIAKEFNISVDAVYEAHNNALRLLRNPKINQED